MGFEIIKAETRTARMVEWFAGMCSTITDFLPGSKVRTKFETVAVEMEAQDYAFMQALRKAIPISIYQAFGFSLQPATKASGMVTFTGTPTSSNITIPAGTLVSTTSTSTPKTYATSQDVTMLIGQTTVQAPVVCTSPGVFGNTPSASITRMNTTINGITSVTNVAALNNGKDRETEDARRTRFNNYITTLTRGTKEAVMYGASTAALYDVSGAITEMVMFSNVVQPAEDDPMQPAGEYYCYIYNGSGATSDALVTEAQKIIDGYTNADGNKIPGYKAAGTICTVVKATESATDVTCTVTPISAETDKTALQSACTDAITSLIQELGMGDDVIVSQIINRIMGIAGIYKVDVATPSADIAVPSNAIPTVGTITVTVL
ncbi:MAG: baseplate J/gp47 family protein [Geobacter sp.]